MGDCIMTNEILADLRTLGKYYLELASAGLAGAIAGALVVAALVAIFIAFFWIFSEVLP
jgi:hypothetical protein